METPEAFMLVGAILVVFAACYFVARNEIVKRKLVCPRKGKIAEVDVLRRFEGRRKPLRIKSCSLFADPRKVECEQDCLESCA